MYLMREDNTAVQRRKLEIEQDDDDDSPPPLPLSTIHTRSCGRSRSSPASMADAKLAIKLYCKTIQRCCLCCSARHMLI